MDPLGHNTTSEGTRPQRGANPITWKSNHKAGTLTRKNRRSLSKPIPFFIIVLNLISSSAPRKFLHLTLVLFHFLCQFILYIFHRDESPLNKYLQMKIRKLSRGKMKPFALLTNVWGACARRRTREIFIAFFPYFFRMF